MPARNPERTTFKKCDCGKTWKTRDEFLRDKLVKIVGYQPDFVNRKYNHFLFRHRAKSCGQLLAVRASAFSDLREKGCPNELCAGKENCPRYCMNTLDLRVCSVACRNATDRALAAKIGSRRILRSIFPTVAPAPDAFRGGAKKKLSSKS